MPVRREWRVPLPGAAYARTLGLSAGRIHCCVIQDKQRSIVAYQRDGSDAWSYSYPPKQHSVSRGSGTSIILDGRKVAALSPTDGALVAARDFDPKLTHVGDAVTGPTFYVGPLAAAVGYIGLDAGTLATQWQWPEVDAEVRGAWIRSAPSDGVAKFTSLPRLTSHDVSVADLPSARGLQVMFSQAAGLWCQFGKQSAAGIALPSGQLIWQREEAEDGHHDILWSTDTTAYGGSEQLSAYDLATGQLRWRRALSGGPVGEVTCTSNVGYLVTNQRSVLRLTLSDGQAAGVFDAASQIFGLAAIDDHTVVLATEEHLVCVRFE